MSVTLAAAAEPTRVQRPPPRKASLGIQGIESLHLFVGDLARSRDHYVDQLDFTEVARSTPAFETEHRSRACAVEAGAVRMVFIEPLGAGGESAQWLERHPEGLGRVVFEVADAAHAHALLLSRGATPVTALERKSGPGGATTSFEIATALGDTLFRFVEHEGAGAAAALTKIADAGGNRFGITHIDHVSSNFLTLQPALAWMEQVMGFEHSWAIEFHTASATAPGSGLKSVVMKDPQSGLTFANNEPACPAFKSSQIYRFYLDHGGPGVQHVALAVRALPAAVRGLRERGVQFMSTPAAYYQRLPERLRESGVQRIEEPLEELRALEILVDGHAERRYLLQIFLREAAGQFGDPRAGPLFLELVQRKGDEGFGGGNFRALFDSIARQQDEGGQA
jgi:4-hydroxyphenylpyruvate dioxygenase